VDSAENRIEHFAKKLAWRRVDDEIVILNLETSVYFSLDGIGSEIWEMIHQKKSEQEIVESLVKKYSSTEDIIRKDVQNLIKQLKKEKLLLA
jgi:hypothetical protein